MRPRKPREPNARFLSVQLTELPYWVPLPNGRPVRPAGWVNAWSRATEFEPTGWYRAYRCPFRGAVLLWEEQLPLGRNVMVVPRDPDRGDAKWGWRPNLYMLIRIR